MITCIVHIYSNSLFCFKSFQIVTLGVFDFELDDTVLSSVIFHFVFRASGLGKFLSLSIYRYSVDHQRLVQGLFE